VRLLITLLALAACRPTDERTPPDAIDGTHVRIATFNVRRFFDTVCDSGACSYEDYEALASPASFEERATQIADAIRVLDADLISLQEIETQGCLDALLSRVGDLMPYGVLGETEFAASVDVAILSKTPIEEVVRHRATSPLALPDGTMTTFARELLEVHVRISDGRPVVLFSAHFKSKSNDDPQRRLAEAQAASRLVGERAAGQPDALVLLAGDLNDTPGSPPLDALVVSGGLVRVADDLATSQQATYYYRGNGQAIDHILLAPNPNVFRLPRSTRAWRDATGWGGSDHAALTSDLVLP
jgi:predicted extracellular nuclease